MSSSDQLLRIFPARNIYLNINATKSRRSQCSRLTLKMHIVRLPFALILLIQLVAIEVSCEIFSAISELEKLAARETEIIDQLEELAAQINHEYLDR